eukprot:15355090-Ditylum_brightwellii.AAC.1
MERRAEYGGVEVVGEVVGSFRVCKFTLRHGGSGKGGMGQVWRELILTRNGFLMEQDVQGGGVVSCRH